MAVCAVWTRRRAWTHIRSLILPPSLISLMVSVDVKNQERRLQNSGAVWTGRWAWTLIPCPILPPSPISLMVSVDVKHRGKGSRFGSASIRHGSLCSFSYCHPLHVSKFPNPQLSLFLCRFYIVSKTSVSLSTLLYIMPFWAPYISSVVLRSVNDSFSVYWSAFVNKIM